MGCRNMKMKLVEVRKIIQEIIRKRGNKWVLYTKKKGKNGKRRRLGTHRSKAAAKRQEIAIKANKG
jgi:hypothetical protein